MTTAPDDRATVDPGQGSNAAQLKDDINSGRTGDKVGGFDAAAAPLGTDEEAGGAPHDPELMTVVREAEAQGRPQNATPNAATPELQPNASMPGKTYILPALIGVGLAVVLAVAILALL